MILFLNLAIDIFSILWYIDIKPKYTTLWRRIMDIKISLPQENTADEVSFLRQKSVRETFRLHTHDFYEFFYIVRGKAIHEINGENQILSEGDFVLIRTWDAHKYSFLDNFDI